MNSLFLSVLVVVVGIFHVAMHPCMRRGNVKTGFCAIWCIDAIFAVCGTVISYVLYQYAFRSFLTMRNAVLILLYPVVTILFVWLTPSGFSLFCKKRDFGEEEIWVAECRLNDTLGMVRNCFMILLFLVPVLFAVCGTEKWLLYSSLWKETEICGGFCFVAFLILIPISLRQAMFWLKNLTDTSSVAEERLLKKYYLQLRYRQRNRSL